MAAITVADSIIELIQEVYDPEELREIRNALKEQLDLAARMLRRAYSIGQQVEFSPRQGEVVHGEIIKINQKNILVKVGQRTWKVNPTLLRPCEEVGNG